MSTLAEIQDQKQNIRIKRVLLATDFSNASRQALAYALAIARRYDSALSIVHAIPPHPRDPIPMDALPRELNRGQFDAEQQMKRLGENMPLEDLNYHTLIQQGAVWDVLASVIQSESADLLVLGTHGRSGLKKLALGSVAEAALRLAPCPVLTIGPHVPPVGPGPVEFRRILFATDFGLAANKAFPYALSLAEDHRAKLILLHMVPPMPSANLASTAYGPSACAADQYMNWQKRMREESRTKLKELLPPDTKLMAEPECIAAMDFLPEGILDVAATHGTELIVMGANPTFSPRVAAHMPWALVHEVVCEAKCPVLTCTELVTSGTDAPPGALVMSCTK
jgi:nucleotide-binding universal stress UspA family protein